MCILFLHTDNNPAPNAYKLILASNRDEYFPRPTRQAHFWDEDSRVIGGRDLEPGREGGSWLALSSQGRIAVLLNVAGENVQDPSHNLGRGFLVSDFVMDTEHESQHMYLKRVAQTGHKYNPFNFISIEICSNDINIWEYSNGKGSSKVAEKVGIGTRGWSNSIPACPFRKVTAGTSRLKEIVETHGRIEDKEILVQKLLSLLKWEESHMPDPELQQRLGTRRRPSEIEVVSAVYVKNNSEKGYGTRTHSIILIDVKGKAEFMEWTMEEPIDPNNPTWLHVEHSCQFTSW